MSNEERQQQTGATSKQIVEAPRGAIFLWVNDAITYPRHLAKALGRDDLEVIGPTSIVNRLRASTRPVVIDHAMTVGRLRQDQLDALEENDRRLKYAKEDRP